MRYHIIQAEPVWLETSYIVEAENEEEAITKLRDGDYEHIGFDVGCNVENVDSEIQCVELMEEGVPFVTYPADDDGSGADEPCEDCGEPCGPNAQYHDHSFWTCGCTDRPEPDDDDESNRMDPLHLD